MGYFVQTAPHQTVYPFTAVYPFFDAECLPEFAANEMSAWLSAEKGVFCAASGKFVTRIGPYLEPRMLSSLNSCNGLLVIRSGKYQTLFDLESLLDV